MKPRKKNEPADSFMLPQNALVMSPYSILSTWNIDGIQDECILEKMRQHLAAAVTQHRDYLSANTQVGVNAQLQASFDPVLHSMAALTEQLESLYLTDPLTRLGNRRAFIRWACTEFDRSLRLSRKIAVVILDIDFFKSINDRFGHDQGDLVLQEISKKMRRIVRAVDFVGRWGGEEFLLAFTHTTPNATCKVVERIRAAVGQIILPDGNHVTLSGGIVMFPYHGIAIQDCISAADAALYQSKNDGRDRVSIYSG